MEKRDLKLGDVVQIDPEHDDVFGGCFMLVTEPKDWGAQGFVHALPGYDDKGETTEGGRAYYRCEFEDMEYVGRAEWVPRDDMSTDDED